VIVVDASALVAIGAGVLLTNETRISAVNYVEAGLVLIGRGRLTSKAELNIWLATLGVEIVQAVDLAEEALLAYLTFGRGYHPARLNMGDCFAYALAKSLDAPLLYKGDDFALTDVRSALQPT
jgi:ribonuclease VapC